MDGQISELLRGLLVIALGVVAILNGRRFFWVFVGIGGAVVGLWLSAWLLTGYAVWIQIAVTLLLAGAGVVLAFNFEKVALHIAAFILGGFIVQFLFLNAGYTTLGNMGDYIVVFVGGLIGFAFEYLYSVRSLIVLSSLTGAAMIAGIVEPTPAFGAALFSAAAALGMLLQSRDWIDYAPKQAEPE